MLPTVEEPRNRLQELEVNMSLMLKLGASYKFAGSEATDDDRPRRIQGASTSAQAATASSQAAAVSTQTATASAQAAAASAQTADASAQAAATSAQAAPPQPATAAHPQAAAAPPRAAAARPQPANEPYWFNVEPHYYDVMVFLCCFSAIVLGLYIYILNKLC